MPYGVVLKKFPIWLTLILLFLCIIVDTTPPVVVCTDDVPLEVELGTTGTIAVWTGPTATDISGVTSLTERSQSPGSFFSVGKTTVTYVFSDNTGNSATCIFCVCITTG